MYVTEISRIRVRQTGAEELSLITPGDVIDLEEGMEDLYIVGTVAGFQKVTKIDGLQHMRNLSVSGGAVAHFKNTVPRGFNAQFPLLCHGVINTVLRVVVSHD